MSGNIPNDHGKVGSEPAPRRLEMALDDCLEQVLLHRVSPRACQAQYPEMAEDLAPLLQLAESIAALPDAKPSAEFKRKTRLLLVSLHEPSRQRQVRSERRLVRGIAWRALIPVGLALVLLGVGSGGIVASADALPGSPLYSVKRQVEGWQISLAVDPAGQASVHMMLADRRLEEAEELAALGSAEQLAQAVDQYDEQMTSALDNLERTRDDLRMPIIERLREHLAEKHQELYEREEPARGQRKQSLERALHITEQAMDRVNRIRSTTMKSK